MLKARGKIFHSKKRGFTLIEVMIDISIIAIISVAVLTAYSASFKAMELAKSKIAAVALANEQMEELHNLPYDSLATEHGTIYPPGNILDNEEIVREGIRFNVHTAISYVDDPYDGNVEGSVPGKPQDFYPYDYKKTEVTVSKVGMNGYLSRLVSNIAAKAAETPSNSGIIKICVVDSTGLAVPEALVTIKNTSVVPNVDIESTTGNDGCIMVPNLPEDTHNNYHLSATKNGYSIDSTYPRTAQNPNATFPDVNVMVQQVTNQTLIIDKLSTMNINIVDTSGQPVPSTNVHIESLKEIYFNPSTPKFSSDLITDASGNIILNNMEFGDYNITVASWNIVMTSPYQPVGLKADTTLEVRIVVSNSPGNPIIKNCEPISGNVGQIVSISISGDNFDDGLTIKLINQGGQEISGSNIVLTQDNAIEADFDLSSAALGFWDIVITNPDGGTVRQLNGFEVKN